MMNVMDVSRYQGDIDWDQVKASGEVDAAMLKTVSTNSKFGGIYIDPKFEANFAACKRLGIPVGVYYYTYATDYATAAKEIAKVKEALAGKTIEMPVALDLEENKLKKLSTEALTDLAAYHLKEIEAMGFYAMLYTYTSFGKAELHMTGAALKPYDVWLADYTGRTPKVSWSYGMHQYTSTARIPGVSGNVDMSRATKNYPGIIATNRLGGPMRGE